MRHAFLAAATAAGILAAATSARANGRFPASNQILFSSTQSSWIVVRNTFGITISKDGGNSWYQDTQRREKAYGAKGLRFVGIGFSGGEEGARHGPSLMPGGEKGAYDRLHPVLESIAAKTSHGACVSYVGPDGAGRLRPP